MNTTLICQLSRRAIICASLVFTVPASAWTLQDDPNSTWTTGSSFNQTPNGNGVTFSGIIAENLTANILPDLTVIVPYAWVSFDNNTWIPLTWSNSANGWYSSDFDNLGTSLTLSVSSSIAGGSVTMGSIADVTGTAQFPLTSPCTTSPSCSTVNNPLETLSLTSKIPYIDLGAFTANQSKLFDVSFTATYGNGMTDPLYVYAEPWTLAAIPAAVPVPGAVWLFGSAMIGFIGLNRHKQTQQNHLA